jgi:hypothetical protein
VQQAERTVGVKDSEIMVAAEREADLRRQLSTSSDAFKDADARQRRQLDDAHQQISQQASKQGEMEAAFASQEADRVAERSLHEVERQGLVGRLSNAERESASTHNRADAAMASAEKRLNSEVELRQKLEAEVGGLKRSLAEQDRRHAEEERAYSVLMDAKNSLGLRVR